MTPEIPHSAIVPHLESPCHPTHAWSSRLLAARPYRATLLPEAALPHTMAPSPVSACLAPSRHLPRAVDAPSIPHIREPRTERTATVVSRRPRSVLPCGRVHTWHNIYKKHPLPLPPPNPIHPLLSLRPQPRARRSLVVSLGLRFHQCSSGCSPLLSLWALPSRARSPPARPPSPSVRWTSSSDSAPAVRRAARRRATTPRRRRTCAASSLLECVLCNRRIAVMGGRLTCTSSVIGFAPPDAVLGHQPLDWPVQLLDHPRYVLISLGWSPVVRSNHISRHQGLWPDKSVHAALRVEMAR